MQYLAGGASEAPPAQWVDLTSLQRAGSGTARFVAVRYGSPDVGNDFRPYSGGPLEIAVKTHTTADLSRVTIGFRLRDQYGATLISGSSTANGLAVLLAAGESGWLFTIEHLPLRPGVYQLDLWLADAVELHDRLLSAVQLEVIDLDRRMGAPRYDPRFDGPVFCEYQVAPLAEKSPAWRDRMVGVETS